MNATNRAIVLGALAALGAVCACQTVRAQESESKASDELFQANEVSLDLFASGSVNQETIDNISGDRIRHDGRAGAGFGVNYFFTRYLGVSGDAYSEDTQGSFFDSAAGNVVLRVPVGPIAPYIYGGGGHQFDQVKQNFGDAGAGVELRLTHNWGFFVDGRYVLPQNTGNYGVGRAGLRLTF